MSFLKIYGDTEGPLGFPMKDDQAKALDAILQEHPGHEYVRIDSEKATTEFAEGERADVSWIQTEAMDRHGEIVLASGFRDDTYKANPIVTMNHDYTRHPVGRSLWRRKVKDGQRFGVKAKTVYPSRPMEWQEDVWPSDHAWALVKSGLMGGKSIGFVTLKAHSPTDEEVKRRPELSKIRRIVDEWMLVEYCCCWLPVNPEACVDMVNKAIVNPEDLKFVGLELPKPEEPKVEAIPFTPLEEIEKAVKRRLAKIDPKAFAEALWKEGYDRARGRI
jgi:hypothetical protein